MHQWSFDPTVTVPCVVVTCYKRPFGRQPYRWRAQSMGNGRRLSHGGEGFSSPEAMYDNIALNWPPSLTRHVIVKTLP